jgi:integrase
MITEFFGAKTRVGDITLDRLKRFVAWRRARGLRGKVGARVVANATINRELATLRYAFSVAVENRRISRDHPPGFKSVMLPEADPRQGFVEPAEFARLRDALPAYLRNAVWFLYTTGWRKGAMRTLEWARDLKLERDGDTIVGGTLTLQAANAKNKKAQRLPLTGDLLEVIRRAWTEREPECPYVFHDRDRPRMPGDERVGAIGNFKSAWSTACEKAGFPNLYVHDLRRSGGRNLVRAGVPEHVAMAITGHRTRAMFDRYDITSDEDLRNAIERVSDYDERRATEMPKVVQLRQVR